MASTSSASSPWTGAPPGLASASRPARRRRRHRFARRSGRSSTPHAARHDQPCSAAATAGRAGPVWWPRRPGSGPGHLGPTVLPSISVSFTASSLTASDNRAISAFAAASSASRALAATPGLDVANAVRHRPWRPGGSARWSSGPPRPPPRPRPSSPPDATAAALSGRTHQMLGDQNRRVGHELRRKTRGESVTQGLVALR